jgi:hypothetical protein
MFTRDFFAVKYDITLRTAPDYRTFGIQLSLPDALMLAYGQQRFYHDRPLKKPNDRPKYTKPNFFTTQKLTF